jgi:hypothetical protein
MTAVIQQCTACPSLAATAEEEAVTNTWHVVMVDDGGHVLSLQRLDKT